MHIDELVAALGDMMGEPTEWENGAMALVYSDGVTVNLEHDPWEDMVHLHAPLAYVPRDKCRRYASTLLAANLFGVATGGSAAIAYDREEERVVLWDKFPLAAGTLPAFLERLVALRDAAAAWTTRFRDGIGGDAPARGDEPQPVPGMRV